MTGQAQVDGDGLRDAEGHWLLARAAEVREMDRVAITEWDLPGRQLMELAGAGAARAIQARCPCPGKAVILCGGGGNGGDGYVVARFLRDAGWRVTCLSVVPPEALAGDVAVNHRLYTRVGGEVRDASRKVTARMGHLLGHANVIVDGLFGTGLTRPVDGVASALIDRASEAVGVLRVALDVPSGVHADTGVLLGTPFRADLTVSFAIETSGLWQFPGAEYAGEVITVPIGIPHAVVDQVGVSYRRAHPATVAALLPSVSAAAHKGSFGHVGVLGGFPGAEGAGVLAGVGALRVGAGLVTWCTVAPPDSVQRPPEIMVAGFDDGLPRRPGVWVAGPGLGQAPAAQEALSRLRAHGGPQVWDADALNLCAPLGSSELPGGLVLTPHPAEAARLLGCATAEVQSNRAHAVQALVAESGAAVVLKGARSWVGAPGCLPTLIDVGDVTLATGGTGDVLSGVVGGLLAQGLAPFDAGLAGAYLHGLAGRAAGKGASRGVTASEVADEVPTARHGLTMGWA